MGVPPPFNELCVNHKTHIMTGIIDTSSVAHAEIRESPDVSEPHRIAHARQQELDRVAPVPALRVLITAARGAAVVRRVLFDVITRRLGEDFSL